MTTNRSRRYYTIRTVVRIAFFTLLALAALAAAVWVSGACVGLSSQRMCVG